jgi:hypothetical protein
MTHTHNTESKRPNTNTKKQTWKNAHINIHKNLQHKRVNKTAQGFGNRFFFRLQLKVCLLAYVCVLQVRCSVLIFWSFCVLWFVCLSFIATCDFWLLVFMCVSRLVALWFVIWYFCVLYVDILLFDLIKFLFLSIIINFLFLKHKTMDIVNKHN